MFPCSLKETGKFIILFPFEEVKQEQSQKRTECSQYLRKQDKLKVNISRKAIFPK